MFVLGLALALPAVSNAFLFGLTFTNAAGVATLVLNAQTVGLLSLGVLGATLGLAAVGAISAAALAPPPPPVVVDPVDPAPVGGYGGYGHHGRRRRQALVTEKFAVNDLNQVFDAIFLDIAKNNMDGCFQRLVCDISARPAEFQKNLPIVAGVEMAKSHTLLLSPKATSVSQKLLAALEFGKATQDVKACEQVYNQCEWSGEQMNEVISQLQKQVTIEP